MMSADRSESYLLATATADQNSVNFFDEFTLKQAFFIDLQCRNKLGCGLAKFKFCSYGKYSSKTIQFLLPFSLKRIVSNLFHLFVGMQQSDLSCLEVSLKRLLEISI